MRKLSWRRKSRKKMKMEKEVKKNTIDYTLVDNDNGSYTVRYKVDVEVEGLKIQVKYRN
jgi:hypothetical protein